MSNRFGSFFGLLVVGQLVMWAGFYSRRAASSMLRNGIADPSFRGRVKTQRALAPLLYWGGAVVSAVAVAGMIVSLVVSLLP
jgi:hypothetical protein